MTFLSLMKRKKINLFADESEKGVLNISQLSNSSINSSNQNDALQKKSLSRSVELTIFDCFNIIYKGKPKNLDNFKTRSIKVGTQPFVLKLEEPKLSANLDVSVDARREMTRQVFVSPDTSVSTRSILRQTQNRSNSEKHVSFDESFNQEFVIDCEFKGPSAESRASSLKTEKKSKIDLSVHIIYNRFNQ